jgi:hypothetical protein
MGDDRNPSLLTERNYASSNSAVIKRVERDLDRREVDDVLRLV